MADVIRNFYFKNYLGEVLNLRNEAYPFPFFHKPNNLGFRLDVDTIKIGTRDFITSVSDNFEDIRGELIVGSYEELKFVSDYIARSQYNNKSIRLYYHTTETDEKFYYEVFVYKVDVTEKSTDDGLLTLPIQMKRLSNRLEDVVITITNEIETESEYVTFPLPTEDSPFIKFQSEYGNLISLRVFNSSYEEIPVKLTLKGDLFNPSIENLTNGLTGAFNIPESESEQELVVNSVGYQYIELNGERDYNVQDKSKDNYLYLNYGWNDLTFEFNQSGFTDIVSVAILEFTREKLM